MHDSLGNDFLGGTGKKKRQRIFALELNEGSAPVNSFWAAMSSAFSDMACRATTNANETPRASPAKKERSAENKSASALSRQNTKEMVAEDADGSQDKVGVGEHGPAIEASCRGGLKRRRAGPTPTTDGILEARMNDLPDDTSGGATERECYLLLLYYLKGAERKGSTYFPPMFEETTDLDLPAKLRREEARAWLQTGKSVQVTDEQIDRHAAELGIERQLGQHMKVRIRRFSELLLALEKLRVVRFGDGVLANRSLFGFDKIVVLKQEEWMDGIIVASESKYFGSPSSVYEMLKMFGFKCLRCSERATKQVFPAGRKNTNKKADIVLSKTEFRHDPESLRKNIPRYCNSNQAGLGIYTKEQSLAGGNALYALTDTVLARV